MGPNLAEDGKNICPIHLEMLLNLAESIFNAVVGLNSKFQTVNFALKACDPLPCLFQMDTGN